VAAKSHVTALPNCIDRLTIARLVRGYDIQVITNPNTSGKTSSNQTSSGRKALATMGRRGGKQAAKRWHDPVHKAYQEAARKPLEDANRRRRAQGSNSRARILAIISQQYAETGTLPTRPEIMKETGLSRATITRHMSALREAGLLPDY